MSINPKQIFKNFNFLAAGKILGDLSVFVLFIVLSRSFGQEGIGQYSLAMGISAFLIGLAEFGIYTYSVKEISQSVGSTECYGKFLTLRILLSSLAICILIAIVPFFPFSFETRLVITLIGLSQILWTLVDGFAGVFVAREDMFWAGFLDFSMRALSSWLAIAALLWGSFITAMAIFPLVAFGHCIFGYVLVAKKYQWPKLVFSIPKICHTFREVIPYGLSNIIFPIQARLDVILLGFLVGVEASGIYNSSYRIVAMLFLLFNLLGWAIAPVASRLFVASPKDFPIFYEKVLNMVVLVVLPLVAGLWLTAPQIIEMVFGQDFVASVPILQILCFLVLLLSLQIVIGTFLTACGRQVQRTKAQWVAAAMNVSGTLLLIPLYGVQGAAWATVFSESLHVVVLFLYAMKVVGSPNISLRFVGGTVGAAMFCLCFSYGPPLPLIVVIPSSVILYIGTLYLFKDIRRHEFREIWQIVWNPTAFQIVNKVL